MRGLRKYLTPFAPDQSGAVSAPEISADLMNPGGLRVKVPCSVQDSVIWMQFLDGMTAW